MSSVDVGVILDLDTWVGKMSQSCISMALYDYYSTRNYTRKLVLHTRNSNSDIVGAASAGLACNQKIKSAKIKSAKTCGTRGVFRSDGIGIWVFGFGI
ncbi:hypothetical protein IFM89_005379 [Coptis chinensis]|uniref:Uncharacterized protein n=1 Tax=Coptis chinensis TaxID=261450 RepID=A0A835IUB1_9MAGN|nr:hypothetical protein IFM89_005379 [Coptis chinensis]